MPPLSVPAADWITSPDRLLESEAVRLFVARATAAANDFALTPTNGPAIAAICRRLDGLPSPSNWPRPVSATSLSATLLVRLERRLPVLTGGARDQPERLQTMRNAIAWSYDLLTPEEQSLFCRLAVFVGGFTLEAAEAICAADDRSTIELLDGIASLVDKSLLRREGGSAVEVVVGSARYQMLDTVWEFGREQLAASGEETTIRERHLVYFRDRAQQTRGTWGGPDYAAWLDQLEFERGNLREALGWAFAEGRLEEVLRLTCAMHYFWRARGPVDEALDWFERIFALPATLPERLRIECLLVAADLATVGGNAPHALARIAEALPLTRALGDSELLQWALQTEGRVWLLARTHSGRQPLLRRRCASPGGWKRTKPHCANQDIGVRFPPFWATWAGRS